MVYGRGMAWRGMAWYFVACREVAWREPTSRTAILSGPRSVCPGCHKNNPHHAVEFVFLHTPIFLLYGVRLMAFRPLDNPHVSVQSRRRLPSTHTDSFFLFTPALLQTITILPHRYFHHSNLSPQCYKRYILLKNS